MNERVRKPAKALSERNRVLRWQGWVLVALGVLLLLPGEMTRAPVLQVLMVLGCALMLTVAALRRPHE